MDTLGKAVKHARIDRGMKALELSKAASLTPKYLSEIENEHVDPRFSIVERLAKVLDLDLRQITANKPRARQTGTRA